MTKHSDYENRLLENVAAISGEFHGDTRAYARFYDDHGEKLGGFPGIWTYLAEAAWEFTQVEALRILKNKDYWCSHDYIETIDAFVEQLHLADSHTSEESRNCAETAMPR